MAKKLPVLSATNDNSIWHMFGPPPLLPGERRADFDLLLERLVRDEKPTDTIEHAWVWDIAVFTFEIGRYRRSIIGLVKINKVRGLRMALAPLYGDDTLTDLLDRWMERDPDAIKYVDTLLERAGLTMDDVTAQTMAVKIGEIERLDRMIMGLEGRRIAVIREIPRRRAAFATLLRKAVCEIEEGEFTEVDVRSERTSGAA